MAQLVLLVVAAAWAAVLIPPMLRSRVDNRPNSSVTDFRRQLSTLQSTSSSPRMRTLGRPLVSSPLQRPAAAGRPGQSHHRQAALHAPTPTRQRTGASRNGETANRAAPASFRSHGDHEPAHRQTHMERPHATKVARSDVRRRRSNVLFLLVVTTACTLFLAATTSSTVLLYVFALSFLALCGYVYLLAQLRQRESVGWGDGWLEQR